MRAWRTVKNDRGIDSFCEIITIKHMPHSHIAGVGHYVPSRVLTNADLMRMVDTSDEWIIQRSGIRERRILASDETTGSMSIRASEMALSHAQLDARELDLIIVATSTPDYLTPPVSSQIQHALGADRAAGFVLTTGCTGFVYALCTAHQFIASGAYRHVLVIGAETLSRFTNWKDRNTCVLFGDGAGAVVLSAVNEARGVLGFTLGSDGSQGHHIVVPAGGSAKPTDATTLEGDEHYIRMNGREVFKFATRIIKTASEAALGQAGITLDQVNWIVPHQANLRIIEAAAESMRLPLSKFVINIERYGNTSAATIPIALSEAMAEGRVRAGQNLLLVTFGAGLTWAAAVVRI